MKTATIIQHTENGMYLVQINDADGSYYCSATFEKPYQYLEYCVINGVDIDRIKIEFKHQLQ